MEGGTVITDALAHHRRGWAVLPLRARDKRPPADATKWGEARLNEGELRARLRDDSNLGLITGTLSGGLVDVDLDCAEAVEGAERFLPATKMTHGHSGQRTHWWYVAAPTPPKTQRWKCPDTRDTLVELRSNRSYTMIPPSTHPNGNPVEWVAQGAPAKVGLFALKKACAQLAAYCYLVRKGWEAGQAAAWVRKPRPGRDVPSAVVAWVQPEQRSQGPASRNEISERTKAIYDRATVGVTLQLLGVEVTGRRMSCPIKQHRKAKDCFSWEGDGGSWYCHACDGGGNVITLVEQVKGLSYLDARSWLEDRLGLERPHFKPPAPLPRPPAPAPPQREQIALPDRSPQPPVEPKPEPWEKPVPISTGPLPPFPVDALPRWLAEWVTQEAEETQTPPDLAAFLALGVLAGALQRKFEIVARSRWAEPLCLYTLAVSPPGTRKSAVFSHATAPVSEWEAEASRSGSNGAQFLMERAARLTKRAERLRGQAEREDDDDKADELLASVVECEAKARAAREEIPPLPRLMFNDVTMERLVGVLARHGGRAGIYSAEGTLFEVAAGRYSSGAANIETLLHAHCGETIRVDRMGRSEVVKNPALTVCLAVQPDVLQSMAQVRQFRGRGLVARFLFAVPPSNIGHREINPPNMDAVVSAAYRDRVRLLLELEQPEEPHALRYGKEAQAVFDQYAQTVEGYLASGGRLSAQPAWGGKLLGVVARLSALLYLADHAGATSWRADLPADVVRQAIKIAEYLIPHACHAHRMIGLDASQSDAEAIVEWLQRDRPEVFTRRQIQRLGRRFSSASQVQGALDLLEDMGWVRQLSSSEPQRRGRPVSPSYMAHPDLVGAK